MPDDVPMLVKLARMVYFINLPPDKDVIAQKIAHSRNCFLRAAGGGSAPDDVPQSPHLPGPAKGISHANASSDLFMFTLEDTESGSCLGTSQVIAHMGGPGNPNVSLRLEKREMFSTSLQTGTSHTVACVHLDETGPTEIGGLILQPAFRGHALRLGAFLSFVRFHFIAQHRERFASRIIAEMMGRISPDGVSLLWEYLGRRFVPLSYSEADRFCQYSREFMMSLLPREAIYLSLLPPEARSVIGEVHAETVPARRLLERIGFASRAFIDPFDGGPVLEADTESLELVRSTAHAPFAGTAPESRCKQRGMVSVLHPDGTFLAVATAFDGGEPGVKLPAEASKTLRLEKGVRLAFTPAEMLFTARGVAASGTRKGRTRSR